MSLCLYYNVPLIPQSTGVSCWAASMAMILSWQNHASFDPRMIRRNPGGRSYSTEYDRTGLDPNDAAILRRFGFDIEPPQCYTVDGITRLLENKGPLWVAGAVDLTGPNSANPHIRVIIGISPGNSADNTRIFINDPWERGMTTFRPSNRGSQYSQSYTEFLREYEGLGARELREPAPVYIAYLRY